MYCRNCGNVLNGERYCTKCGFDSMQNNSIQNNNDDTNSVGLNIVGFIWPFVGLIIYLCIKKDKPIKAKGVGKWSLISFICRIILIIVMIIFAFLAYNVAVSKTGHDYYDEYYDYDDYYDNEWYDDEEDYQDDKEDFKEKIDYYALLATKKYYEDLINNPDKKDFCYSIKDLNNSNYFDGSIKVISNQDSLNITVWLTDYKYAVNGINYNNYSINDIKEGNAVTTTCEINNNSI